MIESNIYNLEEEHREAVLQLRQAVDEIAKNYAKDYAEYESGELKRQMDRAFSRYDKAIDSLHKRIHGD